MTNLKRLPLEDKNTLQTLVFLFMFLGFFLMEVAILSCISYARGLSR